MHSGDSSCVLPPIVAPGRGARRGAATTVRRLAPALGVVGLVNVQLALAGRTALRARGEPARVPHRAVREQGDRRQPRRGGVPPGGRRAARRRSASAGGTPPAHVSVKAAVFPFARFPGADAVLGPGDALDRRGDGERGATSRPPSPRPSGRPGGPLPARRHGVPLRRATPTSRPRSSSRQALAALGFGLCATAAPRRRSPRPGSRSRASARCRRRARARRSSTSSAGGAATSSSTRPPEAARARTATSSARRRSLARVPCVTTMAGAAAAVEAIARASRDETLSLQERVAQRRLERRRGRGGRPLPARSALERGGLEPGRSRASSSCSGRPAGCSRGR